MDVKCLERASCRLRGQPSKIRRANRVAIECHMRGQDAKWLRKCLLKHGTPRMFASPTMDYWSARGLFFFFSPCSAPALGEQAHANIHVYSVCTHAPCAWGRSDPSDCLIQRRGRGSSKGRGVGHPFSVSDKWCRDRLPLRALLSRHRLAVRGGDY